MKPRLAKSIKIAAIETIPPLKRLHDRLRQALEANAELTARIDQLTAQATDYNVAPPRFTGYCPICEKEAGFLAEHSWYRDHLICLSCHSVPRERAIMSVISDIRPNWRELHIHESSPSDSGASRRLSEARHYVSSQYLPDVARGTIHRGIRIENLESQTFADNMFDMVVTQDVFEHVFDPAAAISEIARTIKPGGVYVMTVPIVRKDKPSRRRASIVDGKVVFHGPKEYHGNPMGGGALVTQDWGYDITEFLFEHSGMTPTMHHIDDLSRGIRAEYIEVIVCRKPAKV